MNPQDARLGIFGGTFNPIHHGHLILARAAFELLKLEELVLVPNNRSPLRAGEVLAPPSLRFEMVRRAVADEPGLRASDVEVQRQGTSYTVETLRRFRADNPQHGLVFFIGADSVDSLDRWYCIEEIQELAQVVVLPRPGSHIKAALQALAVRAPGIAERLQVINTGVRVDLSATGIRKRVAAGRSIRWLVPEPVRLLIESEGLYGPGA